VKEETVLVVIDLQERMMRAIENADAVAQRVATLVAGAEALGIPVITTQQYTKGLGETIESVRAAYTSFSYIEKSAFSAMGEPAFVDALAKAGRKTVLICGVESHVCVLQTALDLIPAGYTPFIAADAVGSRKKCDKKHALSRVEQAGVVVTTVESALFELLANDSKSDTFKVISKLVK